MKRAFIILVSTVLVACGAQTFAQSVKIGFAHVFSGPMATFGEVARQGAEIAVQEINETGGILGQKMEIVFRDTAAKPNVGTEAIKQLVEQDKVHIVIGLVSSAVAIAATPLMADLRCPLIVTHAMAEEVTGSKCNPWVFRITWNLDQCYQSAAMLAKEQGATRWTTLGPDYGFGQDSWKYFQKYLKKLGSFTFDAGEFLPMATKDWKPVIKKLADSGANGVMISLWGNNLRDFIRQAHEEKFFEKRSVLSPVGGSVEILVALGYLNMPAGIWFGTPYWFEAYDNPANEAFIKAYRQKSTADVPPSYAAYNAYAAVKMFKAAVEKAGVTDRAAIAKALSGLMVTGLPVGTTTFRAEDHQAVFDIAFGKTSGHAAKDYKRIRGLDPIRRFSGSEVTPPAAESGCRMPQ